MAWTPPQTFDPTKVKALITTKWSGTAYKSATIRRVEQYTISSQLDSDADPWTLDLGNTTADLNSILARDNEVRVQIFGASTKTTLPILTGIMDDATYSEDGTIQLSGRDMSCIPVESDHWPNIYRGLSPTKIIEMEARALKCATKFQITEISGGPKRQQTDGSEKYWEFWYRMVRKDGYWIWMLANGTLVVSKLNYNDPPIYTFAAEDVAKGSDIPVVSFAWHKTTQGRIGKLGVEWRTQNVIATTGKPSLTTYDDVNIKDWLKRPNKIIQDKHAVSQQSAYKVAVEELFESRVGAIEITLTVRDPGFLIQQNRMAKVNLPEYDLKSDWFIVGSTLRGGTEGMLQEVRLREKKFAISKRVPDDPVWTKDPTANQNPGMPSGAAGKAILGQMKNHPEWFECFLAAAQKWHGLYDLAFFMATLLAVCDHETGFTNERSDDSNDGSGNTIPAPGEHHVEWTDIRTTNPTPSELDNWKRNFANTGGDGYIPRGYDNAVGPMQLFSKFIKEEADQYEGGKVDEFFGNRWNPCDNIMAAAHLINIQAKTTNGSQADMWAGICKYGGFTDPHCAYGQDIRNRVLNDPGWLQLVQDALSSIPPEGQGTGQWVFPVDGFTAFNFKDGGGPCAHVGENGPNDIWQDNSAHDIMAAGGTKIYALSDGEITGIGSSQSAGPGGHAFGIYLTADDNSEWYYAHMTGDPTGNSITQPPVFDHKKVRAGDLVAYTNRWDGHLHLAIHAFDKAVNAVNCALEAGCDPINVLRAKLAQ